MENASKALLIAGGVLIAIMLLTLFSYLFLQMSVSTSNLYSMMDETEITKFNQQFLNYEGRGVIAGTSVLTVQDVATLINLARDSKEKSRITVEIRYNGANLAETNNYITWLEANQVGLNTYNCTQVHVNSNTRLVDYVIIEINT